jgi:hypothetical protein
MPRIRRGGGRLRASGARTRNDECCCSEVITCSQWNTEQSTMEVSYQINSLTIGTTTGCSCGSVPASGVLAYNGDAVCLASSGLFVFCVAVALGCNSCGGASDPCYAVLYVEWFCSSNTVNMSAYMEITNDDIVSGATDDWVIRWTGTTPASTPLGDVITLSFHSFSSGHDATKCNPSSYADSTIDIIVTRA